MTTLKLDSSGDLAVENNSLVLLNEDGTSEILEETRQRLTVKFKTFLGEWHLDSRVGIPYYEAILVKNPSLALVADIFREIIEEDEAVDSIAELKLDHDNSSRSLILSFNAVLLTGEVLEFADFILEANL